MLKAHEAFHVQEHIRTQLPRPPRPRRPSFARHSPFCARTEGGAVWVSWDFDDPAPDAPRDTSAAAIAASALLELAAADRTDTDAWREAAIRLLLYLGDCYLAPRVILGPPW